MDNTEVIEVCKNFMHHSAFNLINAAETNNPELMWAVLTNTKTMINGYIEALESDLQMSGISGKMSD